MWRQQGDAFQTPAKPQEGPQQAPQPAQASIADLSPPSALPQQVTVQQPPGTPPWQANPVAQTQASAGQLPADLERPNLLSSSSHVQVLPPHGSLQCLVRSCLCAAKRGRSPHNFAPQVEPEDPSKGSANT